MIWVFGDSWANGYGLKEGEKRFSDYFYPVTNLGEDASSLGHTTSTILQTSKDFREGDTMIVITPPDTRWYHIGTNYITHSIFNGHPQQEKVLEIFDSSEWYIYHHSLFIYTLVNLAKDKGMKICLAHNYGKLEIAPCFKQLISDDVFLSKDKSLAHHLLGKEGWANNLKPFTTNSMPSLEGEYFIPGDNHPNEAGHRYIADLLIDKLKTL